MKSHKHRPRIALPPLDAYEALVVANVLESIVSALWRTHGDHMADIIARAGLDSPSPEDALSTTTPIFDLNDIF
jgi:hypothetical protein